MYKVLIRNNETKEERWSEQNLEWEDHHLYWWTDGNMGCDCNRQAEFERAGGIEPDLDKCECTTDKPRFSVIKAVLEDGSTIEID